MVYPNIPPDGGETKLTIPSIGEDDIEALLSNTDREDHSYYCEFPYIPVHPK